MAHQIPKVPKAPKTAPKKSSNVFAIKEIEIKERPSTGTAYRAKGFEHGLVLLLLGGELSEPGAQARDLVQGLLRGPDQRPHRRHLHLAVGFLLASLYVR